MPRARPKPITNPRLAVAYLRVSTEDQALGPDAQLAAIERWAASQHVAIVAVCRDLGASGGSELADRPGFLEALAALEEHAAGLLVVARRDRLARDVFLAAQAEKLVQGRGAAIASADGTTNGTGPEADLMRSIVDAFAAYERALIRSRTAAALAIKKARGERLGRAPFGYRVRENALAADRDEQRALKRIRQLRKQGATIRAIAAQLNEEGVPARAGRWHPTSVARMLARAEAETTTQKAG